ncbi:hypothetical protein 8G_00063 [Ralstonia phage Hyacinthe]|uniref:Uncharacterized protein n=1 Tax=Ralstonia phage Hyacinthe TaxID=2759731 RepID=A0A7G5BB22_9CAUD|nr:hypothetical protein 8G_00063 [Ralstonia phage Hyacinthe]
MAGDWIKMRTDLYRDPKVCMMADLLMCDDGELACHVNQHCQRNMTVTRNVMRNVTVGALVSVWGVMRMQGKCEETDLVCDGVAIGVIDDIADLPGFGAVMEAVGWVCRTEDGLVFPRFFEDNNVAPAGADRSKGAVRQQRYRERQKAKCDVTSDVTSDVTVTPREEKRREEVNNPPNPPSPDGDEGAETEIEKTSKRERKPRTALKTFLAACRANGVKPVTTYAPLMEYVEGVGLPADFLELAWDVFCHEHLDGGTNAARLQANWQQHFANYVTKGYYRLWVCKPDGTFELTSAGQQARRFHKQEAA